MISIKGLSIIWIFKKYISRFCAFTATVVKYIKGYMSLAYIEQIYIDCFDTFWTFSKES